MIQLKKKSKRKRLLLNKEEKKEKMQAIKARIALAFKEKCHLEILIM
jgi:hypothetical protein